jgi:hypothetical protein
VLSQHSLKDPTSRSTLRHEFGVGYEQHSLLSSTLFIVVSRLRHDSLNCFTQQRDLYSRLWDYSQYLKYLSCVL